jgi:two-component system, OmpR family, phosphate regulon sensor histidine kinase PhoR
VNWPFRRRSSEGDPEQEAMAVQAARGRALIEQSREIVVVLDDEERVIGASRRARQSLEGLEEGKPLPERLAGPEHLPVRVPYEVDGRRETLVYLSAPGLAAYEELRAGFTAAVSHELRTPLARLLTLLESAALPGAKPLDLIEQARGEVEQIDELIGEVLFLSELETGREVVALGNAPLGPVVEDVVRRLAERAERAAVTVEVDVEPGLELPLRPRMARVVVENLVENAIRYAGDGATVRLEARRDGDRAVLRVADDGRGVAEEDLPRLFERFFRADRARASRGTGLGLAIVKHVVTSGGGTVDARGGLGRGLDVSCVFGA